MKEEEEDEEKTEACIEGNNIATKASGFRGRMLGEDYSPKSIEFARRLGFSKGLGPGTPGFVEFQQWNVMRDSPYPTILSGAQERGWDVVLDKGTFDAISLSDERDTHDRRLCEGYKERIEPLVRCGGLFLVTSCNWTEEELRAWFEGGSFKWHGAIKYRTFSFGGRKGQTISSVCFRKQSS
jgi:EEF1A lysine methyltransferase 2